MNYFQLRDLSLSSSAWMQNRRTVGTTPVCDYQEVEEQPGFVCSLEGSSVEVKDFIFCVFGDEEVRNLKK